MARLRSGVFCSLIAIGAASACVDPADPGYHDDAGSVGEDDPSLVKEGEDASSTEDAEARADAHSGAADSAAMVDSGAAVQDGGATPEQDAGAHDAGAHDAGAHEADASTESDAQQPAAEPFDAVYALLSQHCTGCHGAGKKLDLSTRALAYAGLVGAQAKYGACASDGGTAHVLVVPGDAQGSLLMAKLENRQICGKAMPPSSDAMNPGAAMLPQASIDVVRAWVTAGAPEH